MVVSIPGGVDNDILGVFETISTYVASVSQVTLIIVVDFDTGQHLAGCAVQTLVAAVA
jgi:hypothetical protein